MKHLLARCALALSVLAALAGCGTTSGRLGELPAITDPANAAKVVTVRVSSVVGAVNGFTVALDGKDLFGIGSGEHAEFRVPAGEHYIAVKCFGGWSPTWKEEALRFNVAAGDTSYFEIHPSMKCAAIKQIDQAAAKQLLPGNKAVSLDNR